MFSYTICRHLCGTHPASGPGGAYLDVKTLPVPRSSLAVAVALSLSPRPCPAAFGAPVTGALRGRGNSVHLCPAFIHSTRIHRCPAKCFSASPWCLGEPTWLADGSPPAKPGRGSGHKTHSCFSINCQDRLPGKQFLVFFCACSFQARETACPTSTLSGCTI